jgi:4-amino-4-deoxy-L-arabinose transferase-like glycosyltransferase
MYQARPFRFLDLLLFLVVLATAGAARAWYLVEFAKSGDAEANAVWRVQQSTGTADEPTSLLVENIKQQGAQAGFRTLAPLKATEEATAHVAPGYPVFRAYVEYVGAEYAGGQTTPLGAVRWLQALLGTLTAGLYFLLARRAFDNSLVGLLAGVFCALNPFAIINVAELQDGALASFLLATALYLGVRGGQSGGALTALLYGLFLAAGALVRAAWLPFCIVALLWFLQRSRQLKSGWMSALVSFLGFLGGLAPWALRNYDEFHEPVPIVSSTWRHLWIGNSPLATGGEFDKSMEQEYLERIGAERRSALAAQPQPRRFEALKDEVEKEILDQPARTLERRLFAGAYFLTGSSTLNRQGIFASPAAVSPDADPADTLSRRDQASIVLYATLVVMLLLGVLGWRWSYAWRWPAMPLSLAVMWIPLPYILSHAEALHGPRLPLDGPLLCLTAFAIAYLLPGSGLRDGPVQAERESPAPARM